MGDMPDGAAMPWLTAALMGTIEVSPDMGGAYEKSLSAYVGKSIFGAAQSGQGEAGQ